jgi:hypothetical protein
MIFVLLTIKDIYLFIYLYLGATAGVGTIARFASAALVHGAHAGVVDAAIGRDTVLKAVEFCHSRSNNLVIDSDLLCH